MNGLRRFEINLRVDFVPVAECPNPSLGRHSEAWAPRLSRRARDKFRSPRLGSGHAGQVATARAGCRLPSQKSPRIASRVETETASDRACGCCRPAEGGRSAASPLEGCRRLAVSFAVALRLYVVIPTEAAFRPTRDLLLPLPLHFPGLTPLAFVSFLPQRSPPTNPPMSGSSAQLALPSSPAADL